MSWPWIAVSVVSIVGLLVALAVQVEWRRLAEESLADARRERDHLADERIQVEKEVERRLQERATTAANTVAAEADWNERWRATAHPLIRVRIELQGTRKYSAADVLRVNMGEIGERIGRGELTGASSDDDVGYRFRVDRDLTTLFLPEP